jgi:MFS family permease
VSGFVDRQILSLLVVPIKRDLGVSDTQVSLLMGFSFVVFYSLLGLPIGRWVDRGRRGLIVGMGAALWSIMTALTGLARTYGQLFAARIGVGVGEATLGPAAVSIIGDSFPRERLGTAMSTYMLGTFFGSGVAYALGAFVVGAVDRPGFVTLPIVGDVYPWQMVFFAVGLPGLLVALLAVTMREPPRRQADTLGASSAGVVPISEVVRYVSNNRRTLIGLSLGFAFSASVNYGIAAWLATFFVRTHGWSIQQAGTLQGILTMTVGVVGTLAGGRLTDYWAKRGIVDAPIRVGILAAIGMLFTAGVYPVLPSATFAALLLVPVNLFAAMPWGAANAAIAESLPSRMRGQGSAVYQLIVNLISGIIGPTAVALLTDRVFGYENALRWSLMLCTVVGMSITIALLSYARPAFRDTVARGAAG